MALVDVTKSCLDSISQVNAFYLFMSFQLNDVGFVNFDTKWIYRLQIYAV